MVENESVPGGDSYREGGAPPKTAMDTQNSPVWKEIQFKDHHSWYLC